MTTNNSNSPLREAILKAEGKIVENQKVISVVRLEEKESKIKPVQEFLQEVTSMLGDIKYQKDYKLKVGDKTGYEGTDDIVDQSVMEHKDDNTYKAIMQLLKIKTNIKKLEEILMKAKVLQ